MMLRFCVILIAMLCVGMPACAQSSTVLGILQSMHVNLLQLNERMHDHAQHVHKIDGFRMGAHDLNVRIEYTHLDDMVKALHAGDVDRILVGRSTALYLLSQSDQYVMHMLPPSGNPRSKYAMLVSQSNPEDFALLDEALDELESSGVLRMLHGQYLNQHSQNLFNLAISMPRFEGADTLRVAMVGDLPPLSILTEEGEAYGFIAAMLREIALQKKVNVELIQLELSERNAALASGKVDVVFTVSAELFCPVGASCDPVSYVPDTQGNLITKSFLSESFAEVWLK